jgi:hypothetical protein
MSILKKAISKKQKTEESFEQEELEFLLKMLSECKFAGKDVQLVYNVAIKIQNQLTD